MMAIIIPSEKHEEEPSGWYGKDQNGFLGVTIVGEPARNAAQSQEIRYQKNRFRRIVRL